MRTDPIADMLTRLRNALSAGLSVTTMPHSKVKESILGILKAKGYVKSYKITGDAPFRMLEVNLDPTDGGLALERVSKPGRRVYVASRDIPSVLGGRGIVIISTSQGLLTGQEARKQGLGGELICKVY